MAVGYLRDMGVLFQPLMMGPLLIDPPILQAPLAGFTNYAYRQIIRRFGGVGLPATEMVSARGVLHGKDSLPERLWGIVDEPRPLAAQIWDNDPANMASVARRLVDEFRVSVVDINFGCPVRDVVKAESGSYLLRYPDRIGDIVQQVAAVCQPAPVTAKIRLGATRDTINAIDVAQAIEGAGGAAVTIHGRTAEDLFRGASDWTQIARVKPHLKHIPLIGNGDLKTATAVVDAFGRYGVDGVMIGRAGLSRPWLFAQAAAALRSEPIPPDPTLDQQRQLLLDHYRLIVDRFGEAKGTILMRNYACHYGQGHPGARMFRREVTTASTAGEFMAVVNHSFPRI